MSGERVNINTADLQTLANLPGIGETLAERIIAYRVEERPFRTTEELAEVAGISVHMVRDIADRISVGVGVEAEIPGDDTTAPDTMSNGRPPVEPSAVSISAGDEATDPVPAQVAEPVDEAPAEASPEAASEAVDEAVEQPAMRIEAAELEQGPSLAQCRQLAAYREPTRARQTHLQLLAPLRGEVGLWSKGRRRPPPAHPFCSGAMCSARWRGG